MMSWWQNLESRDRQILLVGGVLLIIILLYVMVWEPLDKSVRELDRGVDARRVTLQWMNEAATEIKSLQAGAQPVGEGLGGRSLLSVVDQAARQAGLGPSLKRVEPEDKDKVRVWMEKVPFDKLVTWTGGLTRQYGVTVNSIRIERLDDPGLVNARVTLEEATQ